MSTMFLTSEKILYMSSLMCKHGLKIVLEGCTCIVSKNESFVGKSYLCDDMYMLSFNDNDAMKFVYHVDSLMFDMLVYRK